MGLEESEILEAFEPARIERATASSDTQKRHQLYAEAILKKDASILHKYVEGRLREKNS